VHSGYKTISYDRSKIEKALSIRFHTLEETIENVLKGSDSVKKRQV